MRKFSFSVCMSVYKNDNPADFILAFKSVVEQKVKPAEVVLVVDGPISKELMASVTLVQKESVVPVNMIRLEKNQGHAIARQTALEYAAEEWVALMDSDDIALSNRFEKQLNFLCKNPDIAIVGGQIEEFIELQDNIIGKREVPITDVELKKYLKSRCPFNQVTVMFRKDAVLKVGGYLDWFCNEDYYLWIRLALAGYKFANLPDVLVNVRVGADVYRRRGGWRYFKSESKLQVYMWKKDVISFMRLIVNVSIRFVVQVLMPNGFRSWFFRCFARK